ncbi:hypothetical protein [Sanyastnella coralliicola]|uniref:hypothetical protein n=1 Tax=Sanyastnella coralliicola TaxID=3069118 RepID=UPI0027BA4D70|nr:hypothetical protein [Longitalea sp. SCSIO 12813]
MRLSLFTLLVLLLLGCAESSTPENPDSVDTTLNPIIGDLSLGHLSDNELARLGDIEKVRAHLSYVRDYLTQSSNEYPAEIKERRLALLALLSEYIDGEAYPMNEAFEGRKPCFIDSEGTYCAVGYLVKETAGEAAAQAINDRHQYDYIYDMDISILEDWIASSGFTKQEIAMIQPTYDFYRQFNYHTVGPSTEVRNGNLPSLGFGYYYVRYWPEGSRLGGHFMRSYGAVFNSYDGGDWSASFESDRSLAALKRIGLSLNTGLGAKYLNASGESFVQGVPTASLNLLVRPRRKYYIDLAAQYQYGIPLINQDPVDLNRHAFVFRCRFGFTRG